MTARAMHGDRERCLAAGMDSYISKPLEIDTFAQAVAMLAPAAGTSVRLPQLAKEAEALPDSLARTSRIGAKGHRHVFDYDRLRAQTLGKPELLARVLGLFLSDYPQRLSEIRAAAADSDAGRVELVIHSLRGTLRSLGADAAHTAALTIESFACRQDLDEFWARAPSLSASRNACARHSRRLGYAHLDRRRRCDVARPAGGLAGCQAQNST